MTDDRDGNEEKDATGKVEPARRATPRERTLKHLRGLIGAAAGAAISCSGPHKEGVVCDPLPPPMEDAGTGPEPDDRPDGDGSAADARQRDPEPEPPVVCDPLPPPVDED